MSNHAPIAEEVLRGYSKSDFTAFQLATEGQRMKDPPSIEFATMRLVEEAGEVAGVVKRVMFSYRRELILDIIPRSKSDNLKDEMGDVLHALAKLASAAGFSLADIAAASLDKQRTF